MAGIGPAVFSGLLSGLSGLPQGMQAATNEDLARQRLGMEQQQIDLQKQAMQGVEVPGSAVPGGWGTPTPTGGVMLKPQVLPFLQHFTTQQQAQQDRAGGAAALRAAGEKLGNPNLTILADLLEKGALKDAGGAFETEQKGMQAVADANRNAAIINAIVSGQPIDIPTMAPRGTPQTPPPLGGSVAMPPAQAADLANAQRGVAAASEGATAAINAYDKTPRAIPGLIGPPGAGAGGPLTPMPRTPSAYRPDLSLKLGPLTLGLKTPSDERDSYASAMFQGRLFHQLNSAEQQKVLDALPTSPGNRLAQSRAQGADAIQRRMDEPLFYGAPSGKHVVDVTTRQPVNEFGTSGSQLMRNPGNYVTLDTDAFKAWKTINETRGLINQFGQVVNKLTDQPGANIAQAADFWIKNTFGIVGPGADLKALMGAQLRVAGAMQGSRVQLSDQDRNTIVGLIPNSSDTKQFAQNKLRILNNILDAMENAQLGMSEPQALARVRQGLQQAQQVEPAAAPAVPGGPKIQRWGRDAQGRPVPLP